MGDLEEFTRQIQTRLAAARREPNWQPAETARFMAEIEPRRRVFEAIAPQLVRTIVRPRIQALASFFPNAEPDRHEHNDRCICWFGYCDRFPANTKVEIAIEHDEQIKDLIVHYELYIMPVFHKFDPHDKLTLPLDAVDKKAVADWVETKLLAFVDTYLRLDRGQEDFDDAVAVDPVCGMRINCSSAGAKIDYKGHPYYFCTEDCRRRFVEDPLRYVRFETY